MANKTTFWNFIKNNRIEIPIIQRDYAQGRAGKEYLRKSFLGNLKKALDNESPFKDTEMKLDFVYGSIDKGKLNPLDGQQRLTTLWLLHWYIALRAGELNKANCVFFEKFTYRTRISTREFCKELCLPQNFEKFEGKDIVGYITKQTWFYSAWKQDPTIQSILRMLGGTKIADQKGEDIIDGIEELFWGTKIETFKQYWQELTNKDIIVFFNLPLDDFGLSDDLYIKMNARGKQLTGFENFKADLIGYMTRNSEDETLEEIQQKEWNELLNPQSGIPIKLDTDWTDIFWKNKSKDNRIDDIYFAFINRFFLNELVCQKNGNDKYVFKTKELEEINLVFSYLYGNKGDDANIEYVGFEKYKEIPVSFLKNLKSTLNGFCSIDDLSSYFPTWIGQDFQFIPKYIDSSITTLGQKDRIAFFAVSKYIQNGNFNEVTFRQWMRVVWNIVENAGINSISTMIATMRLIDGLSMHSHEIYSFLGSNPNWRVFASKAAQDQLNEEINKAVQILSGEKSADNDSWEKIIVKAEEFAFFNGSIRFLFQDEDGIPDWDNFETKWRNASALFNENGIARREYMVNYIRSLSDDDIIYLGSKYGFSDKPSIWKSILLDQKLRKATHCFLMNQTGVIYYSDLKQQLLLILNNINEDVRILRYWKNNKNVLTDYSVRRDNPNNGYVYSIGSQRHKILRMLKDDGIRVEIPDNSQGEEFYTNDTSSVFCYRGLYATIYYKDYPIRFEGDDKLFLMEKNNPDVYFNDESTGEKLYCSIASNSDVDTIKNQVCDLINMANGITDYVK